MALFVLICFDKPNSLALRMANREDHLAYAREHLAMIRVAGPLLDDAGDMAGSMFLIEAEDRATVQAFNAADPYTGAGLFERVEIRGWKVTLGALA
jgi:uncharacterized protein YciI